MDTKQIKFGLNKLTPDPRDYSHDKNFGTLGASQLPTQDFTIYDSFKYTIVWGDTISKIANKFSASIYEILQANPAIKDINKIKSGQVITIPAREIKIMNQLDLDFCSGFTTAELQKAIFAGDVDPYYQMAKIKQVRGEYKEWGANLRDACMSVIKYGSLPSLFAPFTYSTGGPNDKTRDFLANWLNYPIGLDDKASKNKDMGFFAVDGSNDSFDNIRSTLWLHRTERRAVTFGVFWHNEWTEVIGGIIPHVMPAGMFGGGHDMALIGQKTINGEVYLIGQQSWGATAGDKGFYYFPRAIVNQTVLLGYGMYTFSRFQKSSLGGFKEWLMGLLTSWFK